MTNYSNFFFGRSVLKSVKFGAFRRELLISLLLLIVGCETVVDIEIPMEKPLLVVNSSLDTDGWPKLRLSYSKHILDNASGYQQVANGQIHIQENEGPWIPMEKNEVDGDVSYRTINLFL